MNGSGLVESQAKRCDPAMRLVHEAYLGAAEGQFGPTSRASAIA